MKEILHRIQDVETIIRIGGLAAICAIVFSETGLMIGFFLPGDSLLVTAGILARATEGTFSVSIWVVLGLVSICAIVGDQVGYLTGRRIGRALFNRPDSLLFKKRHVERAHAFYEKYGAKTIVIARFVPIVRTFAPIVAGVAEMNYRTFVTYNVVGGCAWVWSMIGGGYFLAEGAARMGIDIKKHLHVIIVVVIFLSILPGIWEFLREKRFFRGAAPEGAAAEGEVKE